MLGRYSQPRHRVSTANERIITATHVFCLLLSAQDLGESLYFSLNVELGGFVLVVESLELRRAVLRLLFASLGLLELALLALFLEALLLFSLQSCFLFFL